MRKLFILATAAAIAAMLLLNGCANRSSEKLIKKLAEIKDMSFSMSDYETVNITGNIIFSDTGYTEEDVVKAIKANTSSNVLYSPVVFQRNLNTFAFKIDKVKLEKSETSITVSLDKSVLNIENYVAESIELPALANFAVWSAEPMFEDDLGIKITFSQPLLQKQDLKGFITVSKVSKIKFQIESNIVFVYFDKDENIPEVALEVHKGIKNSRGEKLENDYDITVKFESLKPAVELLSKGNIIPDADNIIVPFKTANLKAVDIRIIQIYQNNILSYMQDNDFNSDYNIKKHGRIVYKKTLPLMGVKVNRWNNSYIDLSKLLKKREQGAIYRIEFSFKQEYSVYPCGDEQNSKYTQPANFSLSSDEITEQENEYWDNPQRYQEYYVDWDVYQWRERDNPCNPSYYMRDEHNTSCNVMFSNIGIIAKSNSTNKYWIFVNDIITTEAVSGAKVTLYNYQTHPVASGNTSSDGVAEFSIKDKAYFAVAEYAGQTTYLRLAEGENNSMSRFDVEGKIVEKGLKGFIYGERGVWRPGDTIHLTFILYDKEKRIPENHPVTLEVYNAKGQFYRKQISADGVEGFYTFSIPTHSDDGTGLWNAYIKLGGAAFHKSLRVETIKPNKLKIALDIPQNKLEAGTVSAKLSAQWLTGITAGNLKSTIELTVKKANTQFKGFEKYTFNNPVISFTSSTVNLFDGQLNAEGNALVNLKIPQSENAPGMLNADITCRVFEPGGDASVYVQSMPFSPFKSYVGINLQKTNGEAYLETDRDNKFEIVSLNSDGKYVNTDIEYRIYNVGWNWWVENGGNNLSDFANSSHYKPVKTGRISTVNGKSEITFRVNYPGWGRFFIYVRDLKSGHITGGTVYIDWPLWRGKSNREDPGSLKMLSFSTDKTSYNVGESVQVIIPKSGAGTALLTVETGTGVVYRNRIAISGTEETKFSFDVTPEMTPNCYVHISLLQKYKQETNELPLRLYGVRPINIINKGTVLEPIISMPKTLEPEKEFTVEVSEANGKEITYTLAIVDEGLLSLTNFKTPDPHAEFYAREALGVRTWDMYDLVMGRFSGSFSNMFSVGGDEMINPSNEKANRFKPVVKFAGPFTVKSGGKNKHKITLPMYVGAVRTMVVAGNKDGAFGKAEQTTPVKTGLMLVSSLPRVISTNETISLPVNVFSMADNSINATVQVKTTGLIKVNSAAKTVLVGSNKDELLYFTLSTGQDIGVEKVTVTATGGGKTFSETIEIDVRNPNPPVTTYEYKLLDPDKSVTFNYEQNGTTGDDWVKVELSRIPNVNITERLDFLYNYSHYCSEQLTSKAMPLLYIQAFKDVDKDEQDIIKSNVDNAIKKLYSRQLSNGGISYWDGDGYANEWITSYAGSFLVLAKEKGYNVSSTVIDKWKQYQKSAVQMWSNKDNNDCLQAYRLYSLALAKAPELGAMNRLKEEKNLSLQSKWMLAATYAVLGKKSIAEDIIFNLPTKIEKYYNRYYFGSAERDEAIVLQTLVALGRMDEAFKQAQQLSEKLSKERYFSTQTTAYTLMSLGMFAEKLSGSIKADWTLDGKEQKSVSSSKAVWQSTLKKGVRKGDVSFINKGGGQLFTSIISKTKPAVDRNPAVSNSLRLDVRYTALNSSPLDVKTLKQGSDIVAHVTVTNAGMSNYTDIALTHIIPSGWEVINERMYDAQNNKDGFTYQDIRDDRVLTYFDLKQGASKTVTVRLQATYLGTFILPAIQCEAMYQPEVNARTASGEVRVVK
ncbi:MAG: DUF11 domain-containing protein [Bacteroidales bacterium]|jgi:uncharacterized protein YfaS (alpha-2-macroglobulin family)|nr:DUF11 domain-containing protein [Bacteroidales bacterium]